MATVHLSQVVMPIGHPVFNAAKVSDAIALLAPEGQPYDVGHLLVMLYVVDRRLADFAGGTLTEDQYFGVEGLGPVPRGVASVIWRKQAASCMNVPLAQPSATKLKVLAQHLTDALSETEREIIAAVRDQYGELDSATVRQKVSEEAPEWNAFVGNGFSFKDVLVALGEDEEDAESAYIDWEGLRQLRHNRTEGA